VTESATGPRGKGKTPGREEEENRKPGADKQGEPLRRETVAGRKDGTYLTCGVKPKGDQSEKARRSKGRSAGENRTPGSTPGQQKRGAQGEATNRRGRKNQRIGRGGGKGPIEPERAGSKDLEGSGVLDRGKALVAGGLAN